MKKGENIVFGTNFIAHFLLTALLLPRIKEAPAGRIVNLASVTHHAASKDVLANFLPAPRSPYQDSKLAAILHANHLRRNDLQGTAVTAMAVNPGFVQSEIWRHKVSQPVIGPIFSSLMNFFALPNAQGCVTSVAVSIHAHAPYVQYLSPYYPGCVAA
ncbi:hypothetical protein T484DRAFT_1819511 [Baffinella frigidus]|nr:hypothetical protein T484DRAFT_1819511 [Cryptophyta sp. CCMP2293]